MGLRSQSPKVKYGTLENIRMSFMAVDMRKAYFCLQLSKTYLDKHVGFSSGNRRVNSLFRYQSAKTVLKSQSCKR
jgi:hypothetical protein